VSLPHWLITGRNAVVHFTAWVVISFVRVFPESASYNLGRALALLVYTCFPPWRRISLRNLQLFYQHTPGPQHPSLKQMRHIARDAAISFGYNTIEFIRVGQIPAEQALKMIVETDGVEHYRAALKLGRGVIGLAMHYGNWALGGCYLAQHVKPVYSVNKKQRDSYFTRTVCAWRAKFGVHNITTGARVNSFILRALKDNSILELLADQNGGRRGVFVSFCGIQASTVQGPAALALKTGAPLLLTLCIRLSPGRLRLVVKPPLDISGLPEDKQAAQLEVMRRINSAYEAAIREDPTQWLWGHKRWKTRPPGEAGLY
jgi:Kdo2-lipid IVA lauroyltransferase/acyltransferase